MLLIVEDNPHFSATINAILQRRGFRFDIVDTGKEAIARLANKGETYALAIVDIRLPDFPGDEILRLTRALTDPLKAGIPVVMMTGGEPVEPALLADGSVCAVLYKPFLVAELLRVIDQCSRWSPLSSDEQPSDDVDDIVEDKP